MNRASGLGAVVLLMLPAVVGWAETPNGPGACGSTDAAGNGHSTYVLGPNDRITVQALHAPDISAQPYRVDSTGYVTLPLAERVKAAGLTVEQFEEEVATRLKPYILEPQVSVSVTEFKSQPVSVVGSVKNPGVYQLEGSKTLLEMLSLSGGVAPEASDTLTVTRQAIWGRIPLTNARQDPSGDVTVGTVSLRTLMDAKNPTGNIAICPNDVITVPRARLVYVIGEVHKPGGFVLRDQETTSVLQALSMAEGLMRTAAPTAARILRPQPNQARRLEILVNL
ncbi:MAG: polysaccharide biosynthesis/export family protein, partial [Acidobacteriaceae bacterium]|nr:polysaccharide biosynthesis/export family protein [Acidobacteriaceae bacterium]